MKTRCPRYFWRERLRPTFYESAMWSLGLEVWSLCWVFRMDALLGIISSYLVSYHHLTASTRKVYFCQVLFLRTIYFSWNLTYCELFIKPFFFFVRGSVLNSEPKFVLSKIEPKCFFKQNMFGISLLFWKNIWNS